MTYQNSDSVIQSIDVLSSIAKEFQVLRSQVHLNIFNSDIGLSYFNIILDLLNDKRLRLEEVFNTFDDLEINSVKTLYEEKFDDIYKDYKVIYREIQKFNLLLGNKSKEESRRIRRAISRRKHKIGLLFEKTPVQKVVIFTIYEALENELSELTDLIQKCRADDENDDTHCRTKYEDKIIGKYRVVKRCFVSLEKKIEKYLKVENEFIRNVKISKHSVPVKYRNIIEDRLFVSELVNANIGVALNALNVDDDISFLKKLNSYLKIKMFQNLHRKDLMPTKIPDEILNKILNMNYFCLSYENMEGCYPSLSTLSNYMDISTDEFGLCSDIINNPEKYEIKESISNPNSIKKRRKRVDKAGPKYIKRLSDKKLLEKLANLNDENESPQREAFTYHLLRKNILYEKKMKTKRNPYISELAKRKASGICQLCGNPAPFKDIDGNPFLETHHIEWLSEGGQDIIENTVAICPNCHRKMHVLNLPKDVSLLKQKVFEINA